MASIIIGFLTVALYLAYEISALRGNEPVSFILNNAGSNTTHDVVVEVFNPEEVSIFKEAYSLTPGEMVACPAITDEDGTYKIIVTLDGNVACTYNYTVYPYYGPVEFFISGEQGAGANIEVLEMVE